MRLPIAIVTLLSLAFLPGFLLGTAACSGPHSGKSEKLKKPREKERPEDEIVAEEASEVALDTKCRTNFFAEPTKRRSSRDANRLAASADPILVEAEREEGDKRVNLVVEAINKLRNALKKDPYSPLATFKLAVAYALVGKQGCSVALLERLAVLQQHPDVQKVAARTVQLALKDPAFEPFRKEAQTALGE